ncbi:sensor histidine kinase [uncultured Microbacterium sp.]|uniref:sensor histidine kinase n=1 Tax=uncultured Microbacterium sp. TaxID=191216 RepID=UPI0035C9D34A
MTSAGARALASVPPRAPSWVKPWMGDILAAALIILTASAPLFIPRMHAAVTPLVVVVSLVPAALLPLRRRWPVPVLAACAGCFGIATLSGAEAIAPTLATAIALFGVANRSPRRKTILIALITIAAMTGLSLLTAIDGVFDPSVFPAAVTLAFAAASGDATRSRREYIVAVQERALRAEETHEAEAQRRITLERLRIARDLHDAVAHQIAVISLNAGVASSSLDARPDKTREALATIREASRAVLAEIGELLAMLRIDESDASTTTAAAPPQPGLGELDDMLRQFREGGLEITLRVEGDGDPLPQATDRVAYRVIQEALTNALKHGDDHRANVLISRAPDTLRIVVTNPVIAFDTTSGTAGAARSGHGLIGLRERVGSVRGTVETGMSVGGYRVDASLPLGRENAS